MIFRFVLILLVSSSLFGCGNPPSQDSPSESSKPADKSSNRATAEPFQAETISINTATSDELQRLPHIGASTAQKIIEHRETYGPFKRPEELMQIQGISDVRFRRIRHLIRVE